MKKIVSSEGMFCRTKAQPHGEWVPVSHAGFNPLFEYAIEESSGRRKGRPLQGAGRGVCQRKAGRVGMRTRLKQRIFKRFMEGNSINSIVMAYLVAAKKTTITYDDILSMRIRIEQAIRDCIKEKVE